MHGATTARELACKAAVLFHELLVSLEHAFPSPELLSERASGPTAMRKSIKALLRGGDASKGSEQQSSDPPSPSRAQQVAAVATPAASESPQEWVPHTAARWAMLSPAGSRRRPI